MRLGRFVCHTVCSITTDFVETWCHDWAVTISELMNFCRDPVPRILDHFSTSPAVAKIGNSRRLRPISISVTDQFSRHSRK